MVKLCKRTLLPIYLSFLLVLSLIRPVSAAQVVNYQVYAIAGPSNVTGLTTYSRALSKSQAYCYASMPIGGFSIAIPPSNVSGYLVVAGIYPVAANSKSSGTGWYEPSDYERPICYYFFAASISLRSNMSSVGGSAADDAEPWTGIVYVPAHTGTLYLNVVCHQSYATTYGKGALYGSTAFINFVPDTSDSGGSKDIIVQLEQIVQNIQNIQQEITSSPEQNAQAQEMVEQMQETLDEIRDLVQQIEENTSRPPPEEILPTINPDITNPSDPAAQTALQAVGDLFGNSLITNLLLIVITLAFVRYVLFGKAGGK